MMKKIANPINLFYINILLFLSIFTSQVKSETKIIAKNGDTLIKISQQYGVPLKELMYKNNFNNATKTLEGKVILIPLKNNDNKNLTYKVNEGDTLYKIAREHNVSLKDIISINNLENHSYLKLNQIIILPKGAVYKKLINNQDIKLARKKVFYHQTSKTEELSTIAEIHQVPIGEINTFNRLNNPIAINPNVKLKLRENKASKWLKYGPLIINWSDWTYLDGNYITQAKTKKNTSFYIALSCKKRVLNNTLDKVGWTNWYFPKTDFEFNLINDFCDQELKN